MLHKSLYGLHESGANFYEMLTKAMLEIKNIQKNKTDPCLYAIWGTPRIKNKWEIVMTVTTNVDNLIIGCYNTVKQVGAVRDHLEKYGLPTVIEPDKNLLGCRIQYTAGKEFIMDNVNYIEKMAKECGITHCKQTDTPMATEAYAILETAIRQVENGMMKRNKDELWFPSLIYKLAWFTRLRPDISFATFLLTRYISKWTNTHLKMAVRIVKYLVTTKHMKLHRKIGANRELHVLTGMSDSDYAGDKVERKSVTGYVIFYNGAMLHAVSKQQKLITTSVAHAETIALFELVKNMMFMYNALHQFVHVELPMKIFVDNSTAVKFANFDVCSERTRHWDISLKYIFETTQRGFIKVEWIDGNDNTADIHTKPLAAEPFGKHRTSHGVY